MVGVLASAVSAEGKIKLVKTAIKAACLEEDRQAKILKALTGLEKLCPNRNSFMHHLWCVDPVGTVFTFDFRQPPATPETPVSRQRRAFRSEVELTEACNAALNAAFEICQSAGSDWINRRSLELLTLAAPDPNA
ncbi:hypothetical protein [Methylorubrum aminovorans]|uniref:hypothetical protein n=1 Tax=Methylorubrum aminovorans TaxID=269069 RepID=UPI003C2D569F